MAKDKINTFIDTAKEVQKEQPKIEVRDVESTPYEGRGRAEFGRDQSEKHKNKPKPKNHLIELPSKVDLAYDGKKKEEDLEVDHPANILYEKVMDGEIETSDLTPDDKFVIIKYMRETEKLSADQIAEKLSVSRRTAFNYIRKIKEYNAKALADSTIWEIGGDIYQKGVEAMDMALKMGRPKDFAYVLSMMVSTLQSMGLVFKMPQRSQVQQNIMQEITMKGNEGFKQLQDVAKENDEVTIDAVYEEIMGAVKEGKIEKDD